MEHRWPTVRSDTGAALGTVGHRYEVFQQRKIFTFLEDLADTHGVLWESAGALRGGRRVFVPMQVPDSVIVHRGGLGDPAGPLPAARRVFAPMQAPASVIVARGGLDDEIRLYIVAINSHDA